MGSANSTMYWLLTFQLTSPSVVGLDELGNGIAPSEGKHQTNHLSRLHKYTASLDTDCQVLMGGHVSCAQIPAVPTKAGCWQDSQLLKPRST